MSDTKYAEARTIEGKLSIESRYGLGSTSVGVDSVTICGNTVTTTNGAVYTRAQIEAGEISVRYANGAPFLATYSVDQLFGWQTEAVPAEQPVAMPAPVASTAGRPTYIVVDEAPAAGGSTATVLFETTNANDARTFSAVYARTLKATPGVSKVRGRAGKGHTYTDAAGLEHTVTIRSQPADDRPAPAPTYRERLSGIAAAIDALRQSGLGASGAASADGDYTTLVATAGRYANVVATTAARNGGASRMTTLNQIMNVVRAGRPASVTALAIAELDAPLS